MAGRREASWAGFTAARWIEHERDDLDGRHPADRDGAARAVAEALRSLDDSYLEHRTIGRRDGVERLLAADGMTSAGAREENVTVTM